MVAHSDQLELVAIAGNDELTVYLDDARDNRPVSGVKLALEAEGGTTVARQIEDGLYRIKAEWLRKAGTHDLVFSIASENVNDLLIGELDIPATATSGIGGGEVAAPRFLGISARWLSNGAWLLLGIAATLLLTVSGRLITTVVAVPALASISVIVVISFSSGRLGAGDPATPAIVAASAVERPKRLPRRRFVCSKNHPTPDFRSHDKNEKDRDHGNASGGWSYYSRPQRQWPSAAERERKN